MSASIIVDTGPNCHIVQSMTRMPCSGPVCPFVPFVIAPFPLVPLSPVTTGERVGASADPELLVLPCLARTASHVSVGHVGVYDDI
jgi:hypothetical protein